MASAAAVERVVSRLEGARCEGAALGALRLVVGGEGGIAWQLESGAGVVAVRRGTVAESAGWPPPKATVEATERTARRAAQALEVRGRGRRACLRHIWAHAHRWRWRGRPYCSARSDGPPAAHAHTPRAHLSACTRSPPTARLQAVAGGAGRAAAMGAFMRLRAAASRGEVAVKGDLRALMALRGLIRPASGGGGGGGDLARPLAPAAGATPEALGALEERVLQLEEALADAQQERARQAAAAPPAPPPPAMVPARTQLMLAALAVVVAGPAAGPAVRLVGRWYWQGAAALLAALAALAWRARCDGGQLDRGLATAGFYARIVPAFVLTHRTAGALPPREAEALWDKVHAYWGERLLEFCVAQGGMFIKLGQSLSARPDAAPPLLVKPLAALQDAVPPRPIEEVHDTVCAALGLAAIEDGFEEFDDEPVGSASIAQVHRAVQLGGSGSGEVAVKVRKRGIEPLFRQDMFALRALAAAVAWAFPDHDRRELAAYLCEAVTRELDLQQEGEAMERVREGLARAGVRGCRAPRLVKGTRDVLVMEFIDGAFSLKDDAALKEHAVDRLLVCEAVGRSLAVQFFALGVWNADLHPGNILLQPDASAPANAAAVLIDFGNTCRFTGGQLRAFATLVHAAATNDASLIGEAFDLLGVEGASSGRLADLPRMLKSMRLLLCDTAPADEQRALKKQYFKWAKEDRLKRKELGRASGRRGNSQKVSFPSELLPFAGTILTFKGVCATLGVRVSPMSLFGPAAREVLLAEVAMRTSLSLAGSTLGGGAAVASNNGDAAAMAVLSPSSRARLEGGVGSAAANGHSARAAAAERIAAALMRHLVSDSDGGGLGLQVAVFDRRGGLCEATVELAAGTLGALDGRAVTPATRFALHGAGGAVAAAWAKAVARERNLDPLAPMAGVWKACQGSASRAGPSLCDALTHIAGLEVRMKSKRARGGEGPCPTRAIR